MVGGEFCGGGDGGGAGGMKLKLTDYG